jgi:hypothetical protein
MFSIATSLAAGCLIYGIPKIIAKAMNRRRSLKMNDINNFMYVGNTTRRLHRSRTPALLIKLDIAKAFDSIRWNYIHDLGNRLAAF